MPSTVVGSRLLATCRLVTYAALTLGLIPLQAVALVLHLDLATRLPRWYHGLCTRLFGLRLDVRGRRARARPVLFVTNHSSYLDIMVYSALIPGSFVAKSEIRDWPFFGLLARLQRSVFIDRQKRAARDHMHEVRARLERGDLLILFPEGTSSDGNRVLPFRSALFAVAGLKVNDAPITVQPVTISYTKLDGMPLGRHLRPLIAWYGAMTLPGHLWRLAGLGRTTVVVQFASPVTIGQFADRKALAGHCQKVIAEAHAAAIGGRLGPSRRARRASRLAPKQDSGAGAAGGSPAGQP